MATPHANRIRIIGGAMRGRTIRFPEAAGLRPTPDRVRETLFNWLGQELTGKRCLDLYAGTGALSLEAASRGAALCRGRHNRLLIEALRATAAGIGAQALETHIADAQNVHRAGKPRLRRHVSRPAVSRGPVAVASACLCRACSLPAHSSMPKRRRRSRRRPELLPWRRDKAGQVHYHLFVKPD